MLEIARSKGIHETLHQLMLGSKVDLPDASYDALLTLRVLTVGHAPPPESLDGMVRLAKPGDTIIFSLAEAAYETLGFKESLPGNRFGQSMDPARSFPEISTLSILGKRGTREAMGVCLPERLTFGSALIRKFTPDQERLLDSGGHSMKAA